MKNILLASTFVLLLNGQVKAQNLPSVIPPAPNATSLGKFGEIPVGTYTGVADINIPIWNIKLNGFEMPISLNYHSSGIKTTEYAPAVGLGWALNAGGVITRSINGLADDCQYGFLNPNLVGLIKFTDIQSGVPAPADYDQIWRNAIGEWDSQPDNFYFNFNGRSGKFIFDQNKGIHIIPNQKIKVTAQYQGLSINQFEVVTEDGTKYTFSTRENVYPYTETYTVDGASTSSFASCNPYDQASSWYLTKITTSNNEIIEFRYNLDNYGNQETPTIIKNIVISDFTVYRVQNKFFSGCNDDSDRGFERKQETTYSVSKTDVKRLTHINYNGNIVKFNYNTFRVDIGGDKMLNEIKVINQKGAVVKNYQLDYFYQDENGNSINVGTPSSTNTNIDGLRLFLSSVTEKDKVNNTNLPPYKFSYFPNLTKRLDGILTGTDYWGYYNGSNKDRTINRNPLLSYSQSGTLNKIEYPTGGYSTFEYERNTCQPSAQWNVAVLNENQQTVTLSSYFTSSDPCVIAPNYPCRKEKSFSISNNNALGSNISLDIFLQCTQPSACAANFQIYNSQTNTQVFGSYSLPYPSPTVLPSNPGPNNTYTILGWQLYLPNGNYFIRYSNSDNSYVPGVYNQNSITLKWRVTDGTNNAPAGGLRVKKIVNYDALTQIQKVKTYDYNTLSILGFPSNISAGYILTPPTYEDHQLRERFDFWCLREAYCAIDIFEYLVHHNLTPFVLSTTNNSFVGYSQVIEYTGSQELNNGRTIYKYTSPLDFPLTNPTFPYYVVDNWNMARGLLKEKTDYKKISYGYVPVTRIENSYTNYPGVSVPANSNIINPPIISGLKVGVLSAYYSKSNLCSTPGGSLWTFQKSFISLSKGYSFLTSSKTTNYDPQNGSSSQVTNNYFYDNPLNLQLTRSEKKDSKNNLIRNELKYPHDYIGDAIYGEMVNRNMINGVVSTIKTNITLNKQLSNEKTNFSYFYNGVSTNPLILPSIIQQSINGNTLQTEVTIDKYDNRGNILQTTEKNGIITAYVWGYNNQYPVAKIIGATYDFVLQNSTLNLTLINTTGISDVDMRAELNKIRNNLPINFVTTYTYEPLVGISSETDQTNHTKYYEYDSFNRLSLIRDQDNNILKKICYNYAGQVEDCPLANSTTAQWRATGNTRCQPCPADANYNSGIREKEEKDINPNSPTYTSAPRWVIDPTGTCPVLPNYQPNSSPVCQQNNGVNTGYLITTTADVNPCSNPPNQPGPPILTPSASCIPCNPVCTSPQYQCINGVCVQGILKVVKVRRISKAFWECTSAYCFPSSTGTINNDSYTIGSSTYTVVTTGTTPCEIECF
jgi:hypothetical protein